MENKKIYKCTIKTTVIMEFENQAINIPELQAFALELRDLATKHGFADVRDFD